MASSRRLLTSWAILISCFTFQSSCWGHQHKFVTSAFIKRSEGYQSFFERQRRCTPHQGCNSELLLLKPETILSDESLQSTRHAVISVLNTRGGSSSYGNDDYNDGYGSYRDVGRDEGGRGYSNNDGYNNQNGDRGYSPSYGSGNDGRDRYYDDDYYGRESGGGDNGYYDDEGRYHEDYDDRGRGSSTRRKSKNPKLPAALTSSNRKLGTILLASGAAFTLLGITLFFNKTLMRLGNLLFVAGVPMMIGPGRTVGYFLQPKKARATGCLGCGIFLVLVGHPVIGILLEIFGLLNLFGNMFPLVMMMARNLPVVGGLFGGNNDGGGSDSRSSGKRRESRYGDDRYYEEEGYEREYRRNETYETY